MIIIFSLLSLNSDRLLITNLSEIRIVDEDFRDVELGKTGEVLARGPTVFM
jgi:non-ribosomal peptide synthetase component E (peptide arylation enzyme)